MRTTIGIDPGLSGCLIHRRDNDGRIELQALDMPTIMVRDKRRIDGHTISAWITDIGRVDHVIIEEVQGVQGTGATSAFTFGFGAGLLEGILIAAGREYTKVRPQTWTKHIGVSRDKGEHRQVAMRLAPDSADLFARAKDDGRADAFLLTEWWMRTGGAS